MDPPQAIGDGAGSHERRPAWMAAEIHQSAHREGYDARRFEIAIRPRLAETGNRRHYQRWVERPERLVTETQAFKIARRLILDKHVRRSDELPQNVAMVGGF